MVGVGVRTAGVESIVQKEEGNKSSSASLATCEVPAMIAVPNALFIG